MVDLSDPATDHDDVPGASLSASLSQILRGTGITFAGTLAGMLLAFVSRLLVARFGTESEYGIYTLGLAILSICGLVATLGLTGGLSRNIAAAQAKGESSKIREFVFASLVIVASAGILFAGGLFVYAGFISNNVFHQGELVLPLQIFALAVPFFALLNLGVAVFQGFGRVTQRAFFQNILLNALFIAFLASAFYFRIPFMSVFYAYLTSLVITVLCLALYARRTLSASLTSRPHRSAKLFTPATRYLVAFSLPLLVVAALETLGSWIDTLMLGVLRSPAEVGLYNAALPLSLLVSAPIGAVVIIYIPVISGLYAQRRQKAIGRNLVMMTKWVCLITMPIAFTLFVFPDMTISLFFGSKYAAAAGALRILSIGVFLATTGGLVMDTLLAFGHSRFLMMSAFLTVAVDAILDVLLIPLFSIEGAAVASVSALACWQLVNCLKLYSLSGLHPFSRNLLKPLGVVVGALAIYYYASTSPLNLGTLEILHDVSKNVFHLTYLALPLFFVFFLVVYISAVLLTRSIDEEDLQLITTIETRTGVNFGPLKRFIAQFT
jgi:O-antigen/teichoic acid export membrane protein